MLDSEPFEYRFSKVGEDRLAVQITEKGGHAEDLRKYDRIFVRFPEYGLEAVLDQYPRVGQVNLNVDGFFGEEPDPESVPVEIVGVTSEGQETIIYRFPKK